MCVVGVGNKHSVHSNHDMTGSEKVRAKTKRNDLPLECCIIDVRNPHLWFPAFLLFSYSTEIRHSIVTH